MNNPLIFLNGFMGKITDMSLKDISSQKKNTEGGDSDKVIGRGIGKVIVRS